MGRNRIGVAQHFELRPLIGRGMAMNLPRAGSKPTTKMSFANAAIRGSNLDAAKSFLGQIRALRISNKRPAPERLANFLDEIGTI